MSGRRMTVILLIGMSMVLLGLGVQLSSTKSSVGRISKEELKATLDDPNVVIVDVRLGKDWKASESKIQGSIRVDPANVASLADQYAKDKMLVFYCA